MWKTRSAENDKCRTRGVGKTQSAENGEDGGNVECGKTRKVENRECRKRGVENETDYEKSTVWKTLS